MAKMRWVALTTSDNPFDPIEQFDDWERYDRENKYNTLGLIARFAYTSVELSDEDNMDAREAAIDRIVDLDLVFEGKNGKNITYEKCMGYIEEDIPA